MKLERTMLANQRKTEKGFRSKTKLAKMAFVVAVLSAILITQSGCSESLYQASRDFGQGARLLGGISDVAGASGYIIERIDE